jgi:pullulanase/glycogen debranching enzyme
MDGGLLHKRLPLHSPHPMEDLVILEGHLRDLLGLQGKSSKFGATYTCFSQWLASPNCYLLQLGINALELQPLQEFDSHDDTEYHWGYMPVNYFSPTRSYATAKEKGTHIAEFAALVDECHRQDMDFILDVVYNHVGEPNHLRMLGGNYFFRLNGDGTLSNGSGCGNDFATESPMGRRLILDSLRHLVCVYDVDGFRFDLAELIDFQTICAIEKELRAIKPNIHLIAEPWSFHGHNALALKPTSWSYWNDDFREFTRRYVTDTGNRDGLKYFIGGCTSHLTRTPIQSINYTESHDDRVWIDNISETHQRDGQYPRPNDITRTYLMFAILFACLGVPMVGEGQDFLRSKRGISNSYRDGEINQLSRERLEEFHDLHRYVSQWIRFRLSKRGELLRHREAPSSSFFQFFDGDPSLSAVAVVYNADHSRGRERLLFLVNPDMHTVTFDLSALSLENGKLICDGKKFYGDLSMQKLRAKHSLGAISCQFWSF